MSEIRDYLETQAAAGGKQWMRDGYRTIPVILEAVRAFRAEGGTYNEDAERYIEKIAGDLPEHFHHGHDNRHPLTYQLGHEIYIANGMLRDEKATARVAELEAEGFTPVEDARADFAPFVEGERYAVTLGTSYIGRAVPEYSKPVEGKIVKHGPGVMLIPKGNRTRGYAITKPAMYRPLSV